MMDGCIDGGAFKQTEEDGDLEYLNNVHLPPNVIFPADEVAR